MVRLLLVFAFAVAMWAEGLSASRQAEIEKLVSQEMSRQSIPGMSVSVAAGGEMLWSAGFGMSDLENFVPAKASTVYRLGSVSKPITAVALMQLYEAGRVDLDASIQKYVPAFPRKPSPVTLRELLAHLAGIRHYASVEEMNSTRHFTDMTAPLKIFQDDALVAEPGTKFHYSTFGYVLAGAALEGASGMHYMDYVRQKIFVPAGMDRIRQDHVYAIVPNRARGYAISSTGQVQNCSLADTSNKIAGGGLASTADDLVKFALALRRGVLLKPATQEMMYAPQKLKDGSLSTYGLGWNVRSLDGRRVAAHTGGQQGVSTILLTMPREGIAVALMCNLEKAELPDLANRIARVLYDANPIRESSKLLKTKANR